MATCYIYGAMPSGSTEKLEEGDLLIAADGGYAYLQGQKPDLVVGDFDSLGYVPEGVQIIRHPVQKDDTEMLLAVREGLKRGYRKFVLYGGWQTGSYDRESSGAGFFAGAGLSGCFIRREGRSASAP